MEKYIKISYLLDIYQKLLTLKQVEILNYYYEENLSLGEIGNVLSISRQGAYDLLKRSENLLFSYDEKLGLFDKYMKNVSLIEKIEENISDNKTKEMLNELKENL